jgi:hypothetical protein
VLCAAICFVYMYPDGPPQVTGRSDVMTDGSSVYPDCPIVFITTGGHVVVLAYFWIVRQGVSDCPC